MKDERGLIMARIELQHRQRLVRSRLFFFMSSDEPGALELNCDLKARQSSVTEEEVLSLEDSIFAEVCLTLPQRNSSFL